MIIQIMTNEIPKITHPLGKSWNQPEREKILVDEQVAMMNRRTFNELLEYSCSVPTGVYVGKMWRAGTKDACFLRWYDVSDRGNDYCSIQTREVLFVDDEEGE